MTNRISQFFAVDSEKVPNQGPWHRQVERFERSAAMERFEHRSDSVGRTETERKPFQYRVKLQHVERTQQNPYGLVISSVEQNETVKESFPNPK